MLNAIRLENVGPVPTLEAEFGSRLNLITGDNGLGKTFLLDICWWALTRHWPQDLNRHLSSGYAARPTDPSAPATISCNFDGVTLNSLDYTTKYVPREQAWKGHGRGRPAIPGLVLYAHADGGFSVWDPARNFWKPSGRSEQPNRPGAYVFAPSHVWDGLTISFGDTGNSIRACNGLVADWASWIRERGDNAAHMERLLAKLSPSNDPLQVDQKLARISIDDVRDMPAIRPPYGGSVPILHASSGVRRAVGLAYMLLWSWQEHVRASELLGTPPTNQVILLIDEIESHLHPRWQRTILRSALEVVDSLHHGAEVQLITVTHSPLVLASAETLFNPETDRWFDLDLVDGVAELVQRDFRRRGDVSAWLTSDAFDLTEARSLESEEAITAALALLASGSKVPDEIRAVDEKLRASLGETDRFWLRWSVFAEPLLG